MLTLESLITRNRDSLEIRLANEAEIFNLQMVIHAHQDILLSLENWRLVAYVRPSGTSLHLLGERDGPFKVRITSQVQQIDLNRRIAITASGNHYGLGNQGSGDPPITHLMLIVASAYEDGWAEKFGVPDLFGKFQ